MKFRTAIKTVCVAGSLAMAAATFTGMAAASASVTSIQQASATSAIDSNGIKSVTVNCPANSYVIGTGAQISVNKAGKAALISITPLPGLTAVTAVAAEVGKGTAKNWYLKAYATCISGSVGLYLGSAISSIDSENKIVTAYCPAGYTLAGTGAQVSAPETGSVYLNAIAPNGLSSVSVTAGEHTATASNWYVKAYVICVQSGAIGGLQLVSKSAPVDSTHAKSVFAACPAGTRVLGAAGRLMTPDGQHVIIQSISTVPDLSGVTTVASETSGGTTENWIDVSFAICGIV